MNLKLAFLLIASTLATTATGFAVVSQGADSGRPEATPVPIQADAALPVHRAKLDHDGIPLETPAGAYPLIWVRAHEQVRLLNQPGGELVGKIGRHTEWGSISAFGIVREAGKWAAVTTPLLPNGEMAWVRLDSDHVRGGWTKMAVAIDLSDRRGVLLQEGDVAMSFPVTVGMPGSETPIGRYSVTDAFRGNLNPAYGCCAIALTATQPHLPSGWLGGHRVAIHGTYGALGIAASHGCVRAADATVSHLIKRVPLGAPVFIRA